MSNSSVEELKFSNSFSLPLGKGKGELSRTALLAASAAAVINQIVDQKIDAIMDRTKSRPLIKGNVTAKHAIYFSLVISMVSTYILYEFVNTITMILTLFSIIVYSIIIFKFNTMQLVFIKTCKQNFK